MGGYENAEVIAAKALLDSGAPKNIPEMVGWPGQRGGISHLTGVQRPWDFDRF